MPAPHRRLGCGVGQQVVVDRARAPRPSAAARSRPAFALGLASASAWRAGSSSIRPQSPRRRLRRRRAGRSGPAGRLHQLDGAGQRRRRPPAPPSPSPRRRYRHALEPAGHQQQVAAGQPRREFRRRDRGRQLARRDLSARQRADLGRERPLADDVDADVRRARRSPGARPRPSAAGPSARRAARRRGFGRCRFPGRPAAGDALGVNSPAASTPVGITSDPLPADLVAVDGVRQMLAGHREGIDEVSVASRHVADVAASVGLLDVKLDDHRRRSLEARRGPAAARSPSREFIMCMHLDPAGVDEVEDELRELVPGHALGERPHLLGVRDHLSERRFGEAGW